MVHRIDYYEDKTVKRLNSKPDGKHKIVSCPSCGRKGELHVFRDRNGKPPFLEGRNADIYHKLRAGLLGMREVVDSCIVKWPTG